MYKLFLPILFVFFAVNIQAQDFKGTRAVGLIIGVSQSNVEEDAGTNVSENSTSLRLAPEFTYFVTNRWRIGFNVNFEQSDRTYYPNNPTLESRYKSTTIGGAFLSTYHYWFSEKIAFLIEPSLGFNRTQFESMNQASQQKGITNSFFTNASIGVLFVIKKRFGVDLTTALTQLAYTKTSFDRPNNASGNINQNEFSFLFLGGDALSVLSNVSIGVKYFF
mgnify:CR=1 FL=1